MQICQCEVRLGGDMRRTVIRERVTVPEIRVLQNIHGADAVVNIRPLKVEKNFDHAEHREELKRVYERGGIASPNPDATAGLVARLFGAYGNLPEKLRDIGYNPHAAAEALRAKADEATKAAEALENAEAALFEDDDLNDDEREALESGGGQREVEEAPPAQNKPAAARRAAAKTAAPADDDLM